jgi:hypothetical protein
MRRVSNVNASTEVFANAFFTMIAFVEKRIAPIKVMRNPAKEILLDVVCNLLFIGCD